MRQKIFLLGLSAFLLSCMSGCNNLTKNDDDTAVERWLTTADGSSLLKHDYVDFERTKLPDEWPVIEIDKTQRYQSMDGFGFALTGGSALVLSEMSDSKRREILKELFGAGQDQIGISYLRLTIGASDLSDRVFSYCDLPVGETDVEMNHFSIKPEREYLLPVLKEILEINPEILIMTSPWSPPVWMKTNQNSIGGKLKPDFYDAYALYFVKYLQAMKAEGVDIDAITVQNEPLHPGNNPSLLMLAEEQAAFIKQSLGPAFRRHNIDTKIVIYDHNADRIDYPLEVLDDPEAAQYVDGSAFHLYGGHIDDISKVHDAYPDKNLYFTEQWIGAPGDFPNDLRWHTRELIVGATRNWCKTVIEWNLAADPDQDPHTVGGCTRCLGAITVDGDEVKRNPAYYIIGHASKFVRPGSVRIASDNYTDLPNVAFETPEGDIVLIVLNDSDEKQSFVIEGAVEYWETLPSGAVATFVWKQ
jgi:glucosylceramidase